MSRPRVTSDLLTHYGWRRAAERDAVGCFTHSSEQGGSRVRQVEPLKHSKQAGSKTLGTNQTTVLVSHAPENTLNVHGRTGNMALSLITAPDVMKAPATSILDKMWKDNHRGDGALRTPPLYLHTGRQSSVLLWFQMENWSIITQKKWKLGAAPLAACSK